MKRHQAGLLQTIAATDVREGDERVHFRVGERQQEFHKEFPLILTIETSSYCNLKCVACPQKDLTRERSFMEPELFRKIVDEAARYDVRTWLHYMGEPLMHPRIFELLDHARNAGLRHVGMSTNARILTEDKIERILDAGLTRFELSLDSLDPSRLGNLRPGGDPQEIIEHVHDFFRIKYARGQRLPITSISFRDLQENADEAEAFGEYWKDILQEPDFVLALSFESWGGYASRAHAMFEVPAERRPCLKLWDAAIVLSDGSLVACNAMYDGQVVMGDVNTHSIREIYDGPRYREMRQRHLEGRASEIERCRDCKDWYREYDPRQYQNLTDD